MYRLILRFSLVSGLLLVLVACRFSLSDDAKSVTLERRDADITVLRNGDIDVIETWEVRFQGGPFKHAFRTMPLKAGSTATHWHVRENKRDYARMNSQRPGTYDVLFADNQVTLNWYFSPTSNDVRTFELRYRLNDALRIYPEGDQIWLKLIEAGRDYPINTARAIVHLPGEFATEQLKAATYLNRVENQPGQIRNSKTVVFTGGPFKPGDEWEIRAQFPHGIVTASPPEWQLVVDQQPFYNKIALISAVLILGIGLASVYLGWELFGRDHQVRKVARFYTRPPDETPPGMVGILIDEQADLRDIVATIIDLARRGFLRISELKSTGSSGVSDTVFVRTRINEATLRPYELHLLNCMFGTSNQQYLSDLRNRFFEKIPYLKQILYNEAVQQGYFKRDPRNVRAQFAFMGIILVILAVGTGVFVYPRISEYAPYSIVVFGAIILVALVFLAVSPFMPRKTAKGAAQVARWRAFKRYLKHIERYTRVADVKQYFDLYLPYALAFGFEHQLVRKFAAVNTPVPDWYEPNPILIVGAYGLGRHHDHFDAARGVALPSVDSMAHSLTTSLDAVCNDFFTMLDSTASALTFKEGAFGTAKGASFLDWLGSDGDTNGWSGGGNFGGGGFGGGASGFK